MWPSKYHLCSFDSTGGIERALSGPAQADHGQLTGVRAINVEDKSLPGGVDRKVVVDPNALPIWARYYEIGTNRIATRFPIRR